MILPGLLMLSCDNQERSDAYGTFEATEVLVSSEANGRLMELGILEGDVLEEDAIVGMVDTTDLYLRMEQIDKQQGALDARLSSINSQIRVQEQQLKNLEVDKSRIYRLFEEGAATQKQVDDINGNYDLLLVRIESTRVGKESVLAEKAALDVQKDQIRESIRKCYVVNPLKGTVLNKFSERGEIVTFGKPLYKIANLDFIELKAYISGGQLPHVKLGQETEVLVDDTRKTNRTLTGVVSWISSEAEFTPKIIQTKDERVNLVYAIKVRIENDGSLKIGMPGEVNFSVEF